MPHPSGGGGRKDGSRRAPYMHMGGIGKEHIMSHIPDARSRYTEPLYKGTRGAAEGPCENAYWQGNLDESGRDTLTGYDICMSSANSLFDSLDLYGGLIDGVFGDGATDAIDGRYVNGIGMFPDMPLDEMESGDVNKDYEDYGTLLQREGTRRKLEKMNQVTKAMLLFKHMLNDYLEMQRDELNAVLIEGMPDGSGE